jgi:signal peptidase II
MKKYYPALIVFIILFIDQASKILVKTNMLIGQEIVIANWFKIHFTENEGMAFGMVLPGIYGKIALSTFRVFAVGFLVYLIRNLVNENAHWGFVTAMSMILAGALGNILDSAVYGLIFSESYYGVASFVPFGTGYAEFLKGHVVDMFFFPLYSGFLPEWIPFFGGKFFTFFDAVFNVADAAITIGVFIILLFQKTFFAKKGEPVITHSEVIAQELQ